MKFRRVYCYGGERKNGDDDFIIGYKADNGAEITPVFLLNYKIGYRYNGKTYELLTLAKRAAEKEM